MHSTLREILAGCGGRLVVPPYQRRYVWGQERPGERDSASRLIEQIIDNYRGGHGPYFLQGITLGTDPSGAAVIVDGQQRLTFLVLMLKRLGYDGTLQMLYACRDKAQAFMATLQGVDDTQDVHYMLKSLRIIDAATQSIEHRALVDYLLDNMTFMVINVPDKQRAITAYRMINGTKALMQVPDIIKADLMRNTNYELRSTNYDAEGNYELRSTNYDTEGNYKLRSTNYDAEGNYELRFTNYDTVNERHPVDEVREWQINDVRTRYATEWEEWVRWWHRADVAEYYRLCSTTPMELLISLCLMDDDARMPPLTYERYRRHLDKKGLAADDFFYQLRCTQRRFVEAFNDSATYNRIQAIILLQDEAERFIFLHRYFVVMDIDAELLDRCYKLSFLGMSTTQILRGDSPRQHFEELLATIGLSDVYHNTQAKAEVFKLLLRLNIDEDIKLGRRFDFSVWNNRSLEHIYSKSKVWHRDAQGRVCDGNDNDLRTTPQKIGNDPTFMHRGLIVNHDGMPLSEHCVGNLVLLYGQNNADFGNASFDQKKLMFLTPGGMTAFRSRNLLHSVCVFAAKDWTPQSIVDNYNLTLKNLKLYYGYK